MCHQLMEDCNTVQPDWRPKVNHLATLQLLLYHGQRPLQPPPTTRQPGGSRSRHRSLPQNAQLRVPTPLIIATVLAYLLRPSEQKGTQLSLLSATSRGSAASGLSAQSAASGASNGSASSGWEGYENRKPVMLGQGTGQVKSASQYALRAKMMQHGPPPAHLQQQQKASNFAQTHAGGTAPPRAITIKQGSSKNLDDYIQVMDV